MQLSDIFAQLTYGELSQVSLGGGEIGQIGVGNYSHVMNHVNMGMTALHKRFNLKEQQLTLQIQPGMTSYILKDTYAVSSYSSNIIRPILDSLSNPFQNNIIKIQAVHTDSGYEMALNNQSDPYSVFTPSFNILNIPIEMVSVYTPNFPIELRTINLTVSYQANAIAINMDNGLDSPEDTEIDLPDAYLEPLVYFVASRIMTPLGIMQNEGTMGGIYAARYENACKRIEADGLDVDQGSQSSNLRRRGWV